MLWYNMMCYTHCELVEPLPCSLLDASPTPPQAILNLALCPIRATSSNLSVQHSFLGSLAVHAFRGAWLATATTHDRHFSTAERRRATRASLRHRGARGW